MEDIDSPRKKSWAADQALDDLRWLGIDWDGPPLIQTTRLSAHVEALDDLVADGLVYPCVCSRRDVVAAQSAPHKEEDLRYPGTCRGRFSDPEQAFREVDRPVAWRFTAPSGPMTFEDGVRGTVTLDPATGGGDFVVGRWDPEHGSQPGYQLAVVVDDAFQGVDLVVRGDDLLTSTPRQMLIQRALGLPTPDYAHVPLVIGADGRRLAKRHGDSRLSSIRERGESAEPVRRWIAESGGLSPDALSRPEASSFRWEDLPRDPVAWAPPDS